MRRWWAIALAALAAVAATGCSNGSYDATTLADAVGPTFTNLYAKGQALSGRSDVPRDLLGLRMLCTRGGQDTPDEGPGDDWSCVLSFVDPDGLPRRIRYEITWKPSGCYTAEGAPTVVGDAAMQDAEGRTRVNPIYAFDGCVRR